MGKGEGSAEEGRVGSDHTLREFRSFTLVGTLSQALRTDLSHTIVSCVRDIQIPRAIDRNTDIIQQGVDG
jgi:hypothetical protein